MAANFAKTIFRRKYPVACHVQSARYPRPEYRAKNSESRIVEPGVAGMRPAGKEQAKPVDEVTDCLNLTFCHSRAEALRQVRKPDARELPEAVFFLWRCLANNVN